MAMLICLVSLEAVTGVPTKPDGHVAGGGLTGKVYQQLYFTGTTFIHSDAPVYCSTMSIVFYV